MFCGIKNYNKCLSALTQAHSRLRYLFVVLLIIHLLKSVKAWYNIQLYLQSLTNRKSYMIYRTAPFSVTLNDPYHQLQGHAIL